MEEDAEHRKEQRLNYYWPIWFAEDFDDQLAQGQMADISSDAAGFTCYADGPCPYPGQQIATRFSVPRFGPDGSFDMADFIRSARVFRVDNVNDYVRRIAIQFSEPLPFKPGEQENTGNKSQLERGFSLVV